MEQTELNFSNGYHFGDHIFNIKLFTYLTENNKNIIVNYYILDDYHPQIKEFVNERTLIKSFHQKPHNTLDLWMGNGGLEYNTFCGHLPNGENLHDARGCRFWDKLFIAQFNEVITRFINNSNFAFKEFTFKNFCSIWPSKNIEIKDEFKNLDILIINSVPCSGQYDYNRNDWDNVCKYLASKYKVATTLKVNVDIPCTTDENYTLRDISTISETANNIVCVDTGPTIACFTEKTLNNVKKWYVFHNCLTYSFATNLGSVNNIMNVF